MIMRVNRNKKHSGEINISNYKTLKKAFIWPTHAVSAAWKKRYNDYNDTGYDTGPVISSGATIQGSRTALSFV